MSTTTDNSLCTLKRERNKGGRPSFLGKTKSPLSVALPEWMHSVLKEQEYNPSAYVRNAVLMSMIFDKIIDPCDVNKISENLTLDIRTKLDMDMLDKEKTGKNTQRKLICEKKKKTPKTPLSVKLPDWVQKILRERYKNQSAYVRNAVYRQMKRDGFVESEYE
ncbi:hypothetical protein [Fischerella sp. PCC 9605]|uniref:hypothetical protein n=1 Tax=Fischerella sp. PCC 9605 TaxID=1173024 RepID=UPI00047A8727|nr:hypothetical protein [Fischerella sp. PCC 9605]